MVLLGRHMWLAFIVSWVSTAHAGSPYVDLGKPLAAGKKIWLDNCEGCHGYGVGDAPIPMQPDQWVSRLKKGKQVLYRHAIDGFIGPDYSMMPEKGGNLDLSDAEVMSAVDYMTELARFYIRQKLEK